MTTKSRSASPFDPYDSDSQYLEMGDDGGTATATTASRLQSLEIAQAADVAPTGLRSGPTALNNHGANSLGAAGIGGTGKDAMYASVTIGIYMAIGVVFYSAILPEAFTLVDALYFSMTTFTTVGYGDIVPTSQSGRAFTSLYALCGVAVIGNIVSYFGEKMAEKSVASSKDASDKNDDKFVELLSKDTSRRKSVRGLNTNDADANKESKRFRKMARQDSLTYTNFMIQNWVFLPLLVLFSVGSFVEINLDQGGTFIDVSECHFVVTGTQLPTLCLQRPVLVYYTVVTLTTIGYGDFVPNDQLTRGLATILIPLSTISLATIIGRFAEFQLRKREVLKQAKKWEKGFDKEDLTKMDEDGDGKVSKKEFVYFMLISSEKTTQGYLDRLEKLFDELDGDESGYLDESDFLTQIDRSNEKLSVEVGGKNDNDVAQLL